MRRNPLLRILTVISAFMVAAASSAAAQIRGTVSDDTGRPLRGVLVELWSPNAWLAGVITGAGGTFVFDSTTSAAGAALLARGIGYRERRVGVTETTRTYHIVMHAVPVNLPPVTVTGDRELCPIREDQAARALWKAARMHYAHGGGWQWKTAHMRVAGGAVPPWQVGRIDTAAFADMPQEVVLDSASLVGDIRDSGYATPRNGLVRPRDGDWMYPLLDSWKSGHFGTLVFGQLHEFAVGGVADGRTEVIFCPRSRRHPEIEGTLTIGPDTTIQTVSWKFLTTKPVEEAGGEVQFFPNRGDTSRPLLPMSGFFWRKRPGGYYQEWWESRSWILCRFADQAGLRGCEGRE